MSMTLGIPQELAQQARSVAIARGTSVTQEVTEWLKRWIDDPEFASHAKCWQECLHIEPAALARIRAMQPDAKIGKAVSSWLHAWAQNLEADTHEQESAPAPSPSSDH